MCEFCPFDGGPCAQCPDARDPLAGDQLYALGVARGTAGDSLAATVFDVQEQWGMLALVQLQDLIRGWTQGAQDAPSYAADMADPTTAPF